jgi:hypothetical protein
MTILVGATLAATVALAGCSSSKSSSDGSAPIASDTSTAVPSAPSVSDTQLTGTQLTAALLTGSDVPVTGFSASSSTDVDSGGSLTTAKAKFTPSAMSCDDLQNAIGEAGFGESAMSSNALVDSATKEILSQTVYQFANTAAANTFFTTLKARWNSCGTVTLSGQDFSAKLTITATAAKSGVGQQDFANTMIGTENGTPTALFSTVAVDGPDVLIVGANKLGKTTVPTDIDTGSLLAKLIRKVAAG